MKRLISIILLAAVVGVCGCKKTTAEAESGATRKAVVAVKTVPVIAGEARVEIHATGRTDAVRKEDILAPIAGRLAGLKILEGEAVMAGDTLAAIQPRESQAALEGARVLLRSAKTDAERREAERMLALAEATQTNLSVRAPFDGVVSARAASKGQTVAENALLLTLVDLETLDFMADVPLKQLPRIKAGQKCRVHLESSPDMDLPATVDAIYPQSESESQSVKARLRFTTGSTSRLKTGMAGTADIVVSTHPNALLVPKSALLRNDETNQYTLVVVGADSLSHTMSVTIGATSDSLDEIISEELKPGMAVVVEGQYALTDSTKVAATPRPAP